MITDQTRLKAGSNTHWKQKDGEGVLVDFTTGNYFVLDDVCSFFWKRIAEEPQTVAEIVNATLAEYEADRAEVSESVNKFCIYVLAEKLAELA